MFLNKINFEQIGNKVLYLLAQKSKIFKGFLFFSTIVFLFAVWLILFIRPLKTQFNIAQTKFKQLNDIKNICSQSYGQCSILSEKVEHLSAKINKRLKLIGYPSAYLSLGKVIECINNSGMTLIDYSPGKVKKLTTQASTIEKQDFNLENDTSALLEFGKKITFELTIEGNYLNMFNFFKCLSKIKYCLQYNQLSIDKNEQGLIRCKILLDILQISK